MTGHPPKVNDAEALYQRGPAASPELQATAEEFAAWLVAIPPARRVEVAGQMLDANRRASDCFIRSHETHIEHLSSQLSRVYDRACSEERARLAWWLRAGADGPASVGVPVEYVTAVRELADVIEAHPERWADAPAGSGTVLGMTTSTPEPTESTTDVSVETPAKDETTVEVDAAADPAGTEAVSAEAETKE